MRRNWIIQSPESNIKCGAINFSGFHLGNQEHTRCLGHFLVKGGYKEFDELACATSEPVTAVPDIVEIPIDSSFKYGIDRIRTAKLISFFLSSTRFVVLYLQISHAYVQWVVQISRRSYRYS